MLSAPERIAEYREFIKDKTVSSVAAGFECSPEEVNPLCFPHQRDTICWMVGGGRRAVFSSFGLGKSITQLEAVRISLAKSGGKRGLIVLPLGVKAEFERDARFLATGVGDGVSGDKREELRAWVADGKGLAPTVVFVRTDEEAVKVAEESILDSIIFLTNYESVREGKISPELFDCVSLDEADILRGFGGSKTARTFFQKFEESNIPRFAATASPAPNEFEEILAYAQYLGVMDVGQAKTRFFKRDSEKADRLTIHPHKEREFWLWVASWALFITTPSDLGYPDEGYELPELEVVWHEVPGEMVQARPRGDGQMRLLADASLGVVEQSREKATSVPARVAKMLEIRAAEPDEHRVIWHDREDERKAIEEAIPGLPVVFGSQRRLEEREAIVRAFADGESAELGAKPVMLGSGCNLQRHCARAIYLGIGYKFKDFIQSVHRLQRFGQKRRVRIDLIHTEAERTVKEDLLRKWRQHEEMQARMREIVREYGLSLASLASLTRTMDVEEAVAEGSGKGERSHLTYRLVHQDAVIAAAETPDDSIDLICTSIPFSSQYEYSPSYLDFGHTDSNDHFWAQMRFLSRELFRILRPGRVLAVHVKDRVTPGGINGFGFQTITPFSDETAAHFREAGFALLSRITIVTDVVRENNATYRLGYTEQCKDGSRMGNGLPEYLLVLRKPPSDRSTGYADQPVLKDKGEFSLGRWQLHASGTWRSSGDRILARCDFPKGDELKGRTFPAIYRMNREAQMNGVYDFEDHVALCEELDRRNMLPRGFALVPAHSWHPEVWSDIARMRTLNLTLAMKGEQTHLCPLQFDVVDRVVQQYSMPGETVLDPFSGVGTVPIRALAAGRNGVGFELSPDYWAQSALLMRADLEKMAVPSLFDAMQYEDLQLAEAA